MEEMVKIQFATTDELGGGGGAEESFSVTESDGKRTLKGYAVVWGAISSPNKAFDGKRIQFFRDSLEWTPEVWAFWDHDISKPLATTANGTLRMLPPDDKGQPVEIDLDDTTDGENALKRVRSRLARGMSFGGPKAGAELAPTNATGVYRAVKFLGMEVTVTPFPSMRETSIEVATSAAAPPATAQQTEPPKSIENLATEKEHRRRQLKLYEYMIRKPGKASEQRSRQ